MRRHTLLASIVCAVALAACGEESPDGEACEHLAGGPSQAVTAGAAIADAPAIGADHRRYDVSLVDVTGGKGGVVELASAERASYVLALDADVPVRVHNAQNTEVAVTSAGSSEGCEQIKGRHAFDLDVGTYFVAFGPTSVEKVGLVLEKGGHEH